MSGVAASGVSLGAPSEASRSATRRAFSLVACLLAKVVTVQLMSDATYSKQDSYSHASMYFLCFFSRLSRSSSCSRYTSSGSRAEALEMVVMAGGSRS